MSSPHDLQGRHEYHAGSPRESPTGRCRSVQFAAGWFTCIPSESPSKRIILDASANAVLSIKESHRICSLRSFRHAPRTSTRTLIISPATTASSRSNKRHYEDESFSILMRNVPSPLWQCVTWGLIPSLIHYL